MKKQKFLLLITLFFSYCYAFSQDSITHVVQRGETIEDIAQNYGVTTDDLKTSNPDMDLFYTGLVLCVPPKKIVESSDGDSHSSSLVMPSESRLQAYLEDGKVADRLFEAHEYKKAQKKYKRIISEYGKDLPCSAALYRNALCSYHREKWKSAIEDLLAVINDENCPNKVRNHCRELLEKAQTYRNQQLENRANLWGSLFATAAVVGTSVALASSRSETYSSGGGNSGVSSTSSYAGGSSTDVSSSSSVSSSTSTSSSSCPSLKIARGKYYCANTGRCGMCGGDGLMDAGFGNGANSRKCTLCGGTGRCKYCQ